jgi:hypothetical protein
MLGVTAFGIFFTPVFYSVVRKLTERKTGTPGSPGATEAAKITTNSSDGKLTGHAASTEKSQAPAH